MADAPAGERSERRERSRDRSQTREEKLLNLGWGMEEFNPIECKDWKPKPNR